MDRHWEALTHSNTRGEKVRHLTRPLPSSGHQQDLQLTSLCYVLTVASSTASKQGMNAENASYNLEKVSLCTLRHYNIKPRNVQQQAASTNDETEYLNCAITSVTLVWKLGFFKCMPCTRGYIQFRKATSLFLQLLATIILALSTPQNPHGTNLNLIKQDSVTG